jgi:hypothetical protein
MDTVYERLIQLPPPHRTDKNKSEIAEEDNAVFFYFNKFLGNDLLLILNHTNHVGIY